MSTGTEIVEAALNHIGAHSEVQSASDSLKAACFKHLQSMIAMLEKERIFLRDKDDAGTVQVISIPSDIAGDVNEPLASRNSLELMLAVDFASKARIPVTQIMLGQRESAYSRLAEIYRRPRKAVAEQSSLLHKGQGNTTRADGGRLSSDFFPAPDDGEELAPDVGIDP